MSLQTLVSIATSASSITLIASMIALSGVMVTIMFQWRSFNRQLRSAHILKISDMRQAWINDLRDSMSKFQSYGVTPDLRHDSEKEFYEFGTRIELLMSPDHPNYTELQDCLYSFLRATTIDEKYAANQPFIDVCQKILNHETQELEMIIKSAGGLGVKNKKAAGRRDSDSGIKNRITS